MQDKEKGIGNIQVEIAEDAINQLITVSNSGCPHRLKRPRIGGNDHASG